MIFMNIEKSIFVILLIEELNYVFSWLDTFVVVRHMPGR